MILNYFIIRLFPALTTILLSLVLFLLFFFILKSVSLQVPHASEMGHPPPTLFLCVWGGGGTWSSVVLYLSKVLEQLYTLKSTIFMDLTSATSKLGAPSHRLPCLSCSYASGHLFAFFQTAEHAEGSFTHSQTQCFLDGGLYLQYRRTNE